MFTLLCVLSGFGIGLVSGLIGIGGGTMLVPLFIYGFKMDIYRAVGTSLAVIGPVSIVGAFSHSLKGNVALGPVVFVALAACLGVFASGQLIQWVPAVALKRAFAVFLVIVAVQLVWK